MLLADAFVTWIARTILFLKKQTRRTNNPASAYSVYEVMMRARFCQ
jgi:hypothetical protein